MTRRTAPTSVLAPFLFLCAGGCGEAASVREAHEASVPVREAALAGAPTPACVIEGPGDPVPGAYLVHALPDLRSPIARVARAEQVRARITLSPEQAAVTLLSPSVELAGFVQRDELHFVTRDRVLLAGGALFVERGRFAAVRAVNGSRVTAELPSPFQDAPASIQISCENLAYESGGAGPIRSPTVGWAAQRASGPIALLDGPRGPLVLRAATDEPMRVLEVRDGFTHVSIGDAAPWCAQGIVADVWVASGEIAPREEPADIDDACFALLDGRDRCPAARVAKRTELWLGDPTNTRGDVAHIGWLKEGTALTLLRKNRERLVAVELDDELVVAPPGLAFFADRAAITTDCVALAPDDGCPCDPP